MSAPRQEAVRDAIRDLCRRKAEHDRRTGRLPDSRTIEQHFQEVARRNDRRAGEEK